MGTNVKRKALVLSSFSSTKSPTRFTSLWDNLKPLRSTPTASVCYFLSFLLFGIVFYYYYFLNFLLFSLLWKSDLCENFLHWYRQWRCKNTPATRNHVCGTLLILPMVNWRTSSSALDLLPLRVSVLLIWNWFPLWFVNVLLVFLNLIIKSRIQDKLSNATFINFGHCGSFNLDYISARWIFAWFIISVGIILKISKKLGIMNLIAQILT